MKTIYVNQKDNRSWSTSAAAYEGLTYPVEVPEGFMGGAMTHDRFTNTWVPDPVVEMTTADHIAAAEYTRSELRARVREVTQGWVADLTLGDISDEDRAKLVEWRAYDKRLASKDLTRAPLIEWEPEPGL